MPDRETVNLPDLLGAITGGERVNLDVVQCALGVRPSSTPAGKPFEAVLLLQNASDSDVDVTAHLKLPEADLSGRRNRFFTKRERLLVGLRPAEVGYLTLPVSSSPETTPGEGYRLVMDLAVKRVGKDKPRRVRAPEGGGLFVETELPAETQDRIWQLQQMIFSVERAGRTGLTAPFEIMLPTLGKVADFSPGWVSLWTMRDHVDERVLVERVQRQLDVLLPALKRDNVFFPLLDMIQTRFEQAGYYLLPGESVFIAKLMTLVLEMGVPPALADEPTHYPAWFMRTCRILFDQPQAANNPGYLVSNLVFYELLRDAIHYGFTMVGTVTGENFGDEQEQEEYAAGVVEMLQDGGIDFAHAYLPLVLGGLIASTRIVMPREIPRDTLWLAQKAREKRAPEQNEHNQPIFAMTDKLIDRALDQTG